jgi:hypothetical protein
MRTFFFFVLFHFSFFVCGQTPDYFANDPKWVCGLWNSNLWDPPFISSTSTYVYYLNGDTTINGSVYHRLFSRGETVYSGPAPTSFFDTFSGYYLRQANKNIFYITNSTTTESLLVSYDYSVGDTVKGSVFNACGFGQSTIQKIDSVLINSTYRKVFYIDSVSGPLITEGVGHQLQINGTTGEFIFPLCLGTGFDYSIYCYGWGNTAYWDFQGGNGNCFLNVGIKEQDAVGISVFPNPFSNFLSVKSNKWQAADFILYDFYGRLALQKSFLSDSYIFTSELKSGIYFYEIKQENTVVKRGKIIKD